MAIHALNGLVGSINRPGGMFVHEPLPFGALPEIELDTVASAGLGKPRVDRAASNTFPLSHSLFGNLTEAIVKENKSVDTLLVFSANPAYTLPDGGDFRRTLDKVPFIVSFSPYHDETAYMADLVLPDHTYLEKTDDIVWPTGLQYPLYGLSQPVVEPLYDTKNTGDVIIELSKRIANTSGSAFPWED